ncbi:MAG: 2-hydroxychromene-2-carboxylate isomerase [Hyphomicrobiaceae bacterium]
MPPPIDYYYALVSGFAYLGEPELRRIAAAAGTPIRYKPVDIGRVFAAVDTISPARQSPARRAWRDSELVRWARVRGLDLNVVPKFWPVPAGLASRAVVAAQEMQHDPGKLSSRFLRAVWLDDLDISDMGTVQRLIAEAAPDAAEQILEAMASDETGAIFEANTLAAIDNGVIGSPTFFIEGEMLFGQDRLSFLAEKLGVA